MLATVLITSGCLDNGEEAGETQALSVNEFSLQPNPAPAAQTATMEMQLENVGDATASDVTAQVFGPTITQDEERTWNPENGLWMAFSNLNPATDSQPAIPQRDSLNFETPHLDEGRNLPYDFNANIFYGYETTASTNIEVMSQERYQETGTAQSQTTATNSDAPIHLDIQGSTPIVFMPEGDGTREEDLCVTARNMGTGTPFNPDELPVEEGDDIGDAEDEIILEVEDVGNIIFEENEVPVEIIGNEGFHCFNMNLAGLGDVTTLEQSANIEMEARYGYKEETATSVTVEGRRGLDTGSDGEDGDDDGDDEEIQYELDRESETYDALTSIESELEDMDDTQACEHLYSQVDGETVLEEDVDEICDEA